MNHLDLFSGIGGFALAAKWAGHTTVGFSEIDPYACAVLEKNFPSIKNYGDIRQITRETLKERIDLITGGFPCQPFSTAGKRRGKEDDRDLWPEMFRVICEFKPTWVIGENVAGFVNMELDRTIFNLEAEGYEIQPFIIPACAIGAPHRRDRVWIIAHSEGGRHRGECRQGSSAEPDRVQQGQCEWGQVGSKTEGCNRDAEPDTYANCQRKQQSEGVVGQIGGRTSDNNRIVTNSSNNGLEKHTELQGTKTAPFGHQDWKEDWLKVATRLCRVGDGVPNRVDRLKALGNAIVPQVAYEILKRMN